MTVTRPVVVLVGPMGAGKTTVAALLAVVIPAQLGAAYGWVINGLVSLVPG